MMLQQNFPYGHISSGNVHNRNSLAFLEACYRAEAKDLFDKVNRSVKTDLIQQLRFYNSLNGSKAEAMSFEKSNAESLLAAMDKMHEIYAYHRKEENDDKSFNTR